MTHVGYVVAGYAITFGAVAAYAGWVMAKSRALTRATAASSVERVPPAAPIRPNPQG